MRVSGVKDVDFNVWLQASSPRVFFRVGWQRYAATPDEAIKLARQLIAAVDALHQGIEYTGSRDAS